MAFNELETSSYLGRPVVLYEFELESTKWRYASSARDKVVGGQRYTACPIQDDGVKQSGEVSSDTLTITAPASIGPANVFIGSPPSGTMLVRIRHMHEGDSEAPVVYVGEVLQIDYAQAGQVSIQCLPLSALMEREGLRLAWQRTCPYVLYDPATCKVDKSQYAVPAIVLSAEKGIVKAAEFASLPNGYLSGGFLEWNDPIRGREFRGIEEHAGDAVKLFGLTDGIHYGLRVTAYPGCDLRTETCAQRFNNLLNYGGVPHMPGKSPFDGTPVF